MKHDAISDYLRRVRQCLTCDWGTRRMLLSKLEADLRGRDRTEDGLEELIACVGEPQFVASELMDAIEPRPARFGAKEFRLALVTLTMMLLLWCGFLFWKGMEYQSHEGGTLLISEAKIISRSDNDSFEGGTTP